MNNEKRSGIYKITNNQTKKFYIGSTVDRFSKRIGTHRSQLLNNQHKNKHLQSAFNKYGREAFSYTILEHGIPKEQILEREQYWIDITNACDPSIGYNICKKAAHPNPREFTEKNFVTPKKHIPDGYLVTFPNGLVVHTFALKAFTKAWADEYGLCNGGLGAVATGVSTNHRGFNCVRALPEHRSEPKQLIYLTRPTTHIVFDPQLKRYEVNNLSQFSKEHGLLGSSLSTCASGAREHTQGWQCYLVDQCPETPKDLSHLTLVKKKVIGGKLYTLVDPEGNIHKTKNLRAFCEENNLSTNVMGKLANPKSNNQTYKGWLCAKGDEIPTQPINCKERGEPKYLVTYPEGNEYKVVNLSSFAREHNLTEIKKSFGRLLATAARQNKNSKVHGWSCARLEELKTA